MNIRMANNCPLDLYEFLDEAELMHYYGPLKNDLKIASIQQLKYVEDADLNHLGMSRPEQRRLKKFFQKYYPQTYLGKFVKIMHTKTSSSSSSSGYNGSRRNSGVEQWDGHLQLPPLRQDVILAASAKQQAPTELVKFIIPIKSIRLGQTLSSGDFATVHQGLWTNDQGLAVQVAVKCLSQDFLRCTASEFLKHAAVMHGLQHDRIAKFYGVVLPSETDTSFWLATELAPNRSLLEALHEPLLKPSLSVMTLCDIALQICDGMKYLEANRLFHGDLAARNVLVFAKMKVKISDAGLIFAANMEDASFDPTATTVKSRIAPWCPPEVLHFSRFSSKSDVWAFAVTIWEMFTYGLQPWSGLSCQEISEAICAPEYRRLDPPEFCPKDYYAFMLRCWHHDEHLRPTFTELWEILPESKPEQLQAIRDNMDLDKPKCRLQYTIGDVIVVLDNNPQNADGMWKGVVKNRKPGLFDPSDTVTYLGTDVLPMAVDTEERSMDRKVAKTKAPRIRREMISRPQADFRHTGHVGMDGAYFGDVSFLSNGFGPLPPISRHYDRKEDERSIGYGGSRDTTPLISSRMSLARTVGSESRMSTDSWQNTSSDSPRSSSSRSSGNAKENSCRDPSPLPSKKLNVSPPRQTSVLGSHRQQGYQNGHFEKDITDGLAKNVGNGVDKKFISLRPQDDKSFDLDFGPSLMDEVFRVINVSCNLDGLSTSSSKDSDRIPLTKQSEPTTPTTPLEPVVNGPIPMSAPSIPPNLPAPRQRVIPVDQTRLVPAQVEDPEKTGISNRPEKPEKPVLKPKPQVMARKKLDPINIVKEEAVPSSIKPISPRDEKNLEHFINFTNELAMKNMENGCIGSSMKTQSPKPSTLKSRFSFRGFRAAKPPEVSISHPTSPRSFTEQKSPERELVEELSDEAKEAYRVLVDEGQIEICCPAPVAMVTCDEEDEDEDASPLKLLRNGVGVIPKMRGNRNGFNRSVSHDVPKPAVQRNTAESLGASQSFRLPSKLPLSQPVTNVPNQRQLMPPPPPPPVLPEITSNAKKVERPNIPPPLPPRDRSKPIMGPPAKPRERKYPLVLPENQENLEGASEPSEPIYSPIAGTDDDGMTLESVSNPQYQNPSSPGLVRDKSPVSKKALGNGVILKDLRDLNGVRKNSLPVKSGSLESGREHSF